MDDLWGRLISFENLYRAYLKARRAKQQRDEIARFSFDLEENLLSIQQALRSFTWHPGEYRHFTLYERKPRLISAAPFSDRVIHHALMNVIEPQLDAGFIPHCYACRKGKGTHAAVDQYQRWSRKFRYVLKLDVSRYFPSIDQDVLARQMNGRVHDSAVRWLLRKIIRSYHAAQPGKGMPIGNLTSQFFANVYLDDIDHRVNTELGISAYLRYVDDLVLLANDKQRLWVAAQKIGDWMADIGLCLHPSKIQLYRTSSRVDMFGYLVSPGKRWLRNDNGYRYRRKMKGIAKHYARGNLQLSDITPRVNSWIGHAMHAETEGLRRAMFDEIVFTRA